MSSPMVEPNEKQETVFVLIEESLLSSILKDVVSIGSLALLLWVNHTFAQGQWFVDAFGTVLLGLFMTNKAKNEEIVHVNRSDLRAWVEKQVPNIVDL